MISVHVFAYCPVSALNNKKNLLNQAPCLTIYGIP